eukprot:6202744-Pleurochrysis_carterae.AAC.3
MDSFYNAIPWRPTSLYAVLPRPVTCTTRNLTCVPSAHSRSREGKSAAADGNTPLCADTDGSMSGDCLAFARVKLSLGHAAESERRATDVSVLPIVESGEDHSPCVNVVLGTHTEQQYSGHPLRQHERHTD